MSTNFIIGDHIQDKQSKQYWKIIFIYPNATALCENETGCDILKLEDLDKEFPKFSNGDVVFVL